jgi:hypothetical protein
MLPPSATETSQTRSVPAIAVPTMLPTAPTASAKIIAAAPTATEVIVFAASTRPRCGTRVNVARPVRWLHSPVIARIAIIGSTRVIGKPIAFANV